MTTAQQRPRRGGGGRRRRVCLCKEATIDYKEVSLLRRMLTDRGRMESAKKSGNCAKCQRQVRLAIQQARFLGLLPFATDHIRVTSVLSSAHADEDEQEEEVLEPDDVDEAEEPDEAESGSDSDDVLEDVAGETDGSPEEDD